MSKPDVGAPWSNTSMSTPDLLDFERAWPRHSGAKEIAIRDRGLTPARYYQMLHRAAASLEGQAHDPMIARQVRDRSLRHGAVCVEPSCPHP